MEEEDKDDASSTEITLSLREDDDNDEDDEECYFVYGGDAVDKGTGDIRLVRALVDLKRTINWSYRASCGMVPCMRTMHTYDCIPVVSMQPWETYIWGRNSWQIRLLLLLF